MVGKVLMWGSLAAAVLAHFGVAGEFDFALVLVALGLVSGFMNPIADVGTRVAYYVLAVALPGIAGHLNAIPAVGEIVGGILTNFAVVIAGVAVAQVLLQLMKQLKEA